MSTYSVDLDNTGLEVIDLSSDREFAERELHPRDAIAQLGAIQRLMQAFLTKPEMLLQQLVDAAVELCGADSAGISIEQGGEDEKSFYHWIATSGQYSGFLDAVLPRHPSACGVCLGRGGPQHFRVGKRFFEIMGIEAPLVTDGILLPWIVGESRGTIFVMAHTRELAFDDGDVRVMTMLADLAAMAVRHQKQQEELLAKATMTAEATLARELAHQINNPLQSLTNGVYLTTAGKGRTTKAIADGMSNDVDRLSRLVRQMLKLPGANSIH